MGWLGDWSWSVGVVDQLLALWSPRNAEPTEGALTHVPCADQLTRLEGAWQEQFESLRRQLADLEARLPVEEPIVEAARSPGRHGAAVQRVLARAQRTATNQGLVVATEAAATPLRPRRRP